MHLARRRRAAGAGAAPQRSAPRRSSLRSSSSRSGSPARTCRAAAGAARPPSAVPPPEEPPSATAIPAPVTNAAAVSGTVLAAGQRDARSGARQARRPSPEPAGQAAHPRPQRAVPRQALSELDHGDIDPVPPQPPATRLADYRAEPTSLRSRSRIRIGVNSPEASIRIGRRGSGGADPSGTGWPASEPALMVMERVEGRADVDSAP